MKANHNWVYSLYYFVVIERTKTKIKFESKSQQAWVAANVIPIERTKTKIKFESKSQPAGDIVVVSFYWKN